MFGVSSLGTTAPLQPPVLRLARADQLCSIRVTDSIPAVVACGARLQGTGRKTTPRDFELKGRRTGVAAPATGVGATPRRGADGFEELEDWFGDR